MHPNESLKVVHLINSTYQVIKRYYTDGVHFDSEVVFQGCLADCEAYIRLTDNGYM